MGQNTLLSKIYPSNYLSCGAPGCSPALCLWNYLSSEPLVVGSAGHQEYCTVPSRSQLADYIVLVVEGILGGSSG